MFLLFWPPCLQTKQQNNSLSNLHAGGFICCVSLIMLFPVINWTRWVVTMATCEWSTGFWMCCFRSLRWATRRRPRSSATITGTTSSPGWCLQTRTRLRPCWTSSKPWAGTTSPRSPRRGTTGRAEWTPSCRSPERPVCHVLPSAALFSSVSGWTFCQ